MTDQPEPVHGCTIDGQPAMPILVSEYNRLTAELAALRQVARGYCPECGRGDAGPTAEDWEQQRQRADQAEAERDGAYRERAHLLAWLAALHPAVITLAPDVDEPGWKLLYLNASGWQLSWHISPRDDDLFEHVERVTSDDPRAQWDGHTTEEKYARIRQLAALDGPGPEETDTTPAEPDTCRPVDIDGETIRVRGAGEMSDESRAALGEVIRAARRRMIDEQRKAAWPPPSA